MCSYLKVVEVSQHSLDCCWGVLHKLLHSFRVFLLQVSPHTVHKNTIIKCLVCIYTICKPKSDEICHNDTYLFTYSLRYCKKDFLSKAVCCKLWFMTMSTPVTVASSVSSHTSSADALPPSKLSSIFSVLEHI